MCPFLRRSLQMKSPTERASTNASPFLAALRCYKRRVHAMPTPGACQSTVLAPPPTRCIPQRLVGNARYSIRTPHRPHSCARRPETPRSACYGQSKVTPHIQRQEKDAAGQWRSRIGSRGTGLDISSGPADGKRSAGTKRSQQGAPSERAWTSSLRVVPIARCRLCILGRQSRASQFNLRIEGASLDSSKKSSDSFQTERGGWVRRLDSATLRAEDRIQVYRVIV